MIVHNKCSNWSDYVDNIIDTVKRILKEKNYCYEEDHHRINTHFICIAWYVRLCGAAWWKNKNIE